MTIAKKALILCLFAVAVSAAQKQRVAVLPTMANPGAKIAPQELDLLMERVRAHASKTLPLSDFILLRQDFVEEQLGGEAFFKACKEGACVGDLIAKANADFGARCEIFGANNSTWLKFELYGTLKGQDEAGTIDTFTEEAKDFKAMQALIDKKVPAAFKKILEAPALLAKHAAPPTAGGISGAFVDARDGKKYKTVKIGGQTWMAENLNYEASGSVCYDNANANCKTYGRLYNWEAANKACPPGWHLPSKGEWELLNKDVGGESMAGKKLKAKSGWNDGKGKPGSGTDEFGFAAMPGGSGFLGGRFKDIGDYGYWQSASEHDANYAYSRYIIHSYDFAGGVSLGKNDLFSVRCVND